MKKACLLTAVLFILPLSTYGQKCGRLRFFDVDSRRVYHAGQKIRYDEAHGAYTGLISVDTMYFLCPIRKSVTKSGSLAPGENYEDGAILAYVRRATDSRWTRKTFNYRCEDLTLKSGKMEFVVFNGKEMQVGSHDALCTLSSASE